MFVCEAGERGVCLCVRRITVERLKCMSPAL